jgi:hypothetical protein
VLGEARLNYDEYKAHFREEMASAKGTLSFLHIHIKQ